jgi:hypothetical protein
LFVNVESKSWFVSKNDAAVLDALIHADADGGDE